MALKLVTVKDNVFQVWGDCPPSPLPGLRPWTPLGTGHPSPIPRRLCSSKNSFKNPLPYNSCSLVWGAVQALQPSQLRMLQGHKHGAELLILRMLALRCYRVRLKILYPPLLEIDILSQNFARLCFYISSHYSVINSTRFLQLVTQRPKVKYTNDLKSPSIKQLAGFPQTDQKVKKLSAG